MYGLVMRKAQQVFIWVTLSKISLMLDHYQNLYCQIVGSKTFHLVPPTEYACLKGIPTWKMYLISRTVFSVRKMDTLKRGSNTIHTGASTLNNTMADNRSIQINYPRKHWHHSRVQSPRGNIAARRSFVPSRIVVSFGISNFKWARNMHGSQLLVQHGLH